MITVFNDRIEILSRGALPPKQTREGFFKGISVPVNQKLSDIFLQLHISERSRRGVPQITKVYGKEAFKIGENFIEVTIPFYYFSTEVGDKLEEREKVGDKVGDKNKDLKLNPTRQLIVKEMRNNPNITQRELVIIIGISYTSIQKNIAYLKKNKVIERVGSVAHGWWKIL